MQRQTDPSRKIANEFLSNLETALEEKRFKFNLTLIKRHAQLYRFCAKTKTHFLFIHGSHQGKNFFKIPSPCHEISHSISSLEDIDWALILLKKPQDKNCPLGFLIPRDDFMKSGFTMDRTGLLKINRKDLSLKHQFSSWGTFFQLLNLE